jgi:hypothetical protein
MGIIMDALRPKELLDYLLEANILTPNQLDEFIQANEEEGQYFDYKNGSITSRQAREQGKQIIRRYISGFANSDGGVLIIGVDEQRPRQIARCEERPGGYPLDAWAPRCLHDMVGFFSPPPRYQIIAHQQGPVLAITVARAPSLVPCVESGALKYFFRIGESTLAIPDYLIADLVLGRRQHPRLDVHSHDFTEVADVRDLSSPNDRREFTRTSFTFMVENLSLVAAEQVEVGMVSWVLRGDDTEINRYLRAHIDIVERTYGDLKLQVVHKTSDALLSGTGKPNLEPFKKYPITISSFDFPYVRIAYWLSCAVYVMCKGSPPTWFQLRYFCARGTEQKSQVTLTPMGTERPKVAWS